MLGKWVPKGPVMEGELLKLGKGFPPQDGTTLKLS